MPRLSALGGVGCVQQKARPSGFSPAFHAAIFPVDIRDASAFGTTSEGKVILVDFWTYSCVNCLRAIPWYMRARAEGRTPAPRLRSGTYSRRSR